MRWRTLGAAGFVAGVTFGVLFSKSWSSRPKPETVKPAVDFSPADFAAGVEEMKRQLAETEAIVRKFDADLPTANMQLQRGLVHVTVCDLRFKPVEVNANEPAPFLESTAPDAAKRAAEYHTRVAAERERILRVENLIDAKVRKKSQESIFDLKDSMMEYWGFVLGGIPRPPLRESGPDVQRAWEASSRTAKFHNLQFGIESDELDDIGDILRLIDRARDVKLEGDRLLFATQREQDDYHRLISRVRRLEALRAQRESDFQERLQKQPKNGLPLTQPPGNWEFLINTGASIELDERRIVIEGKSIVLPIAKTELIAKLGRPREVAGQMVRLIWDDLGIMAVQQPGTTMIEKLVIALRSRNEQEWPKQVVRGRLALLGSEVDENSTPWNMRFHMQQRFFECTDSVGREWKLTLDTFKVSTEFNLDGTIDMLMIQGPRGNPKD
jgi:hypothetical protein